MVIIAFLLKTMLVFTALFLLYNIFLKNTTFLRFRRWYLIGVPVLSFLIPYIITLLSPKYYCPEPGSVLAWIDGTVRHFSGTNWLIETWGIHLVNIIVVSILGLGFVLVTAKYAYSLWTMYQFMKESRFVSKNDRYTIRTGNKGNGCFCFLKTIYLCSPSLNEQNLRIILEHEKAHIRQKHYIDVWLSAMCDFFFWYCPFTKQFQLAWEEVLECLADHEAILSLKIEPIVYQSVLYSSMEYSNAFTNINTAFGRSMVAKRLLFISSKPSKIRRLLPKVVFCFVFLGIIATALVIMDVKISEFQKIIKIRNAGYDLHEVTTGYVLDSNTEKPVIRATVQGDQVSAVTDNDGFFFIKKTSSRLSVQHRAYKQMNTLATNGSIIKLSQQK